MALWDSLLHLREGLRCGFRIYYIPLGVRVRKKRKGMGILGCSENGAR